MPIAEQLADLHLRHDQLGEVVGVGGNIPQHKARAGDLGVNAPFLRFAEAIHFVRGIKTVGILQIHHPYFANLAVGDHRAHLQQQRVAGETVSHADDQFFFPPPAL